MWFYHIPQVSDYRIFHPVSWTFRLRLHHCTHTHIHMMISHTQRHPEVARFLQNSHLSLYRCFPLPLGVQEHLREKKEDFSLRFCPLWHGKGRLKRHKAHHPSSPYPLPYPDRRQASCVQVSFGHYPQPFFF